MTDLAAAPTKDTSPLAAATAAAPAPRPSVETPLACACAAALRQRETPTGIQKSTDTNKKSRGLLWRRVGVRALFYFIVGEGAGGLVPRI